MSVKAATGEPSIIQVMHHVRHLAGETPYRKSGSGQDVKAARYIVDILAGYGLDATLEEFETFDSDPGEASLEILAPKKWTLTARACAHIEATPPGGYVGEIVDVGPGAEDDYAGKNVRGKVVLAEVSYAPATPEKARIAAAKGAAGIVLMNWGRGDEPGIPWRALKAVWGNPTPESWNEIPRLFGASISRSDGEAIRSSLAAGPVKIAMTVTARREWRKVMQPIAWLNAADDAPERDKFIIVSGHLDSWSPGVTDNISGNAVMLELARMLSTQRSRLRRSIVFCFWNGHEVAEAAGSTYFVDAHWERINRDAVAYFNIDSVGMKGTSLFNISVCPELATFTADQASRTVGRTVPVVSANLERIGDQSFFGIGVSAATGRHGFSPEVVKQYHGATLGWYNHTEFDTLDVLDETVLARDLDYWSLTLSSLATTPVLPQRFSPRIEDLEARLVRMLDARPDPAELSAVLTMTRNLKADIGWFDRYLDRLAEPAMANAAHVERANGVVLRLSRLLTFLSGSASGKYEQDSYGISTLKLPVPLLASFVQYAAAERDSLESRLLLTRIMRLRHIMTDSLQSAADLLADFRSIVVT